MYHLYGPTENEDDFNSRLAASLNFGTFQVKLPYKLCGSPVSAAVSIPSSRNVLPLAPAPTSSMIE